MDNRILAAACCIPLLVACQPAGSQGQAEQNFLGESVATTVNGTPVHESVFRLYAMNRTQQEFSALNEEQRQAILDELTEVYLLADEAKSRSLNEERTIAAEVELQRVSTLARNMVNRWRENNPITEADLRDAYEKNLESFSGKEYKARHILVNTEEEANAVISDLAGGADFAELAKERSTGPTGPNGGDLGWFDANTMVKPFADAVRGMEIGGTSAEPVQTRFGFHVIALEDSREMQAPGLDQVRNELTNRLESQRVEAFVEELRTKATIGAAPADSDG